MRTAAPRGASAIGLSILVLGACAPGPVRETAGRSPPQRIVSLDFCADHYALALAPRDAIAALSPDAGKPFAPSRDAAEGLPRVRPSAESVLALKPDLVLRAYGGGPGIESAISRAGVRVVNIGWTSSLDDVARVALEVGEALGARPAAQARLEDMRARLAAAENASHTEASALYLTSGAATTGPGTLVHAAITSAGLRNFETTPGWRTLSVERIAALAPDRVLYARFGPRERPSPWSAMGHPLAEDLLARAPLTTLDGALLACGSWSVGEAALQMSAP